MVWAAGRLRAGGAPVDLDADPGEPPKAKPKAKKYTKELERKSQVRKFDCIVLISHALLIVLYTVRFGECW
jgi:hypothetical protein